MNKKCETCIKKDVCNIMKTDPKVKGCGYYLSDLSRYTETQKDIVGALQVESINKLKKELETLRHKITLHKSRENYLLDKIEYMKNCYNCRLLATCLKKSKSICGEWKPKELR